MMLNPYRRKNVSINLKHITLLSFLGLSLLPVQVFAQAEEEEKSEIINYTGATIERPQPFELYRNKLAFPEDVTKIDEKLHTDAFIYNWSANAVQKIMTLNAAADFDLHMDSLSAFFTPQGLQEFRESFEYSGIKNSVKVNDFHMTANLLDIPNIQGSGVMQGEFFQWTVSIPIEVKFIRDLRFKRDPDKNPNPPPVQTSSQEWNLILLVVRSNDVLNPYGIGIEKWITE